MLWKKFVNTLAGVFRKHFYILFWPLLALFGCAQPGSLTGGDVDRIPPKILSSSPLNGSLNFTENSIVFEFDEYVRVAAAPKELLVTPPLKYPVEFLMKGRVVTLNWKDTLLENTTYLFQFGKGIVDVNEGNALDSNLFVFSTGDYLDSFYLEGKVVDAFSLKPVEDVLVMLYTEDVDTLPYSTLPRYFAKTDAQGNYKLQYLSQGSYKIFALKSGNNGYFYDLPEESIGFLPGKYAVWSPADTVIDPIEDIMMFTEKDTLQFISTKQQLSNRGLVFEFNQSVDSMSLLEVSGQTFEPWDRIWNERKDSVVIWFNTPLDYDSLHLEVRVPGFVDTLKLRKPNSGKSRGKGAQEDDGVLRLTAVSTSKIAHYQPFVFTSETPIKQIDLSRSILVEGVDSMSLASYVTIADRELEIDYPWKQGEKYRIFMPDSSVFDRFGRTNDTIRFNLLATKETDFGNLTLNHFLPELGHKYVVELLKADGKVLRSNWVDATSSINYPFLPTGQYRIKVIFDENNSGDWDTGNYLEGIQAERVAFYEQSIEVRSNWITEMEWRLLDGEDAEASGQ
jgi:hypothetical protein